MSAPDALLAAALLRDPAGPLLTYYDDATGERTELSATSLANWVAKTANLLRDDLGATQGDRVAVLLPAHWQAAAILLGAWTAAAVVGTEPDGAAVAFATADRLPEAAAADEVFALSLAPLGRGFADGPPPGARDYSVEVLTMADRWSGRPVPDAVPALDTGRSTVTAGDLVRSRCAGPPSSAWSPATGCCPPSRGPRRPPGSTACWCRWPRRRAWSWWPTRRTTG